jgi:hypothetical protein
MKYFFSDLVDDMSIFEPSWLKLMDVARGEFYDSNEFDLVPRKGYYERRLKEKEQQLSNLEGIKKYYEGQVKSVKEEIDDLKSKIAKV